MTNIEIIQQIKQILNNAIPSKIPEAIKWCNELEYRLKTGHKDGAHLTKTDI